VIAAANKYLVDKPKVTLSVVPKKQSKLQAHKVNYVPAPRVVPPYKHIDDQQLAYRHVPTTFDRSVMPKVNGAITPQVPKLYHQFFDNGLEIMGTESDETPTVLLRLDVPAGERFVARGKEGLAELTAALLDEGTTKHSAEALHAMLDKLGSSISVEANYYSTSIVVSALKENLLPTIDILREMLFHPRFDEADMQRLQKQMVQGVLYQKQKPTWLASQATRQILYGDAIFSRVSDGTEKSISDLTLDDVKAFYSKLYTPHGAKLSVVGELKLEDVENQVAFLADWQGDSAPILAPQILPELNKQTLYVVDKPHAPQSIVRFVRQGLPFDATGELFLSQLANFNLAGNFNSRMNQNLREDKGYTYGLSGYFASTRETGAIVFQAPVRADSTAASITEMIKEMKDYSAKGMTDSELQFMRLAVAQQDALAYETPRQKAGLISGIMAYDLDQDYLQQRTRIVKTVSKNVLNQLANKWFNPNQYQIIVVGDYQALKPELEKLNIPIERLEIRE
jgi:zinc protease